VPGALGCLPFFGFVHTVCAVRYTDADMSNRTKTLVEVVGFSDHNVLASVWLLGLSTESVTCAVADATMSNKSIATGTSLASGSVGHHRRGVNTHWCARSRRYVT
jgi:hypothetical protein